jgi:cold shock CspA family protein
MPDVQCKYCGEELPNEYKRFRHERDCPAKGRTESGADSGTEDTEPRVEGTVETFFEEEGYGFLVTADVTTDHSHGTAHTQDVFVHISDTDAESLVEGDRLRFDIIENEEGLMAKNAERIEREQATSTPSRTRDETDTARRMGFGHQADDTTYGRPTGPTEQDIESFDDDRKFR